MADHAALITTLGGVQAGTLRTYKTIEDANLRDEQEGSLSTHDIINEPKKLTHEDWKNSSLEIQKAIKIGPGASVTFENCCNEFIVRHNAPNCFTICLSNTCDKNIFPKYDACFEILDIENYARITEENIRRFFGSVRIIGRKVEYIGRKHPSGTYPDPVFIKDVTFQKEDEYRLVFIPHVEGSEIDPVRFLDVRLVPLIKRIF
jgi:hypothetical protein